MLITQQIVAAFVVKREVLTPHRLTKNRRLLLRVKRTSELHFKAAPYHFLTNRALLLGQASEVAYKRRARNTKQFCRTALILICLLVNESHVPFNDILQ